MSDQTKAIQGEFDEAGRVLEAFCAEPANAERVAQAARLCAQSLRSGGKILAAGNGGSCADAMHFCEELTGRYRDDRPAIAAIACTDPGHLTCTANDYGYESVFSRWVEALGKPGDVLVVLSTSGSSANVVRAVERAKAQGLESLGLLGKGGGQLKGMCNLEWIVPGQTADRIQELHMLILHALVGAIERELSFDSV